MREKTIKVYEYKELSEKAKEKARAWFLNGLEFDWDYIKEDAKNVGLELSEWDYRRYCKGDFITDAIQVIEKILIDHGTDCRTHKTALEYQAKFKALGDLDIEDQKVIDLSYEFLKDILEDYRLMSDEQYEFEQSEEYIAETMEANEYEFDENGRRV